MGFEIRPFFGNRPFRNFRVDFLVRIDGIVAHYACAVDYFAGFFFIIFHCDKWLEVRNYANLQVKTTAWMINNAMTIVAHQFPRVRKRGIHFPFEAPSDWSELQKPCVM